MTVSCRRAHEIFLRQGGVGFHGGARDTILQITSHSHQRISHIGLINAARLYVELRHSTEETEGLVVVADHAIAIGIHARQLPPSADLAILGGIAISFDSLFLLSVLIGRETELEDSPRALFLLLHNDLVIEGYRRT